jgi:hypothetical protein
VTFLHFILVIGLSHNSKQNNPMKTNITIASTLMMVALSSTTLQAQGPNGAQQLQINVMPVYYGGPNGPNGMGNPNINVSFDNNNNDIIVTKIDNGTPINIPTVINVTPTLSNVVTTTVAKPAVAKPVTTSVAKPVTTSVAKPTVAKPVAPVVKPSSDEHYKNCRTATKHIKRSCSSKNNGTATKCANATNQL